MLIVCTVISVLFPNIYSLDLNCEHKMFSAQLHSRPLGEDCGGQQFESELKARRTR